MNKIIAGLILLLIGFSEPLQAQNKGVIAGTVIDKSNQLPLYGVSIKVENTEFGTVTDSLGRFRIMNIDTRSYNVLFTRVGYKSYTIFNVVLTSGNELNFSIELEQEIKSIAEITVTGRRTAKVATLETPLSVQRLTTEEIKANPGGNFDISRVINTLPGVGGTAGSVGGFRNGIIIRVCGPG